MQYPPHLFNRDPLVNLGGDFLRCASGLGVVDDPLHHHARSLDAPCAAASVGDALNIGAVGPVHATNISRLVTSADIGPPSSFPAIVSRLDLGRIVGAKVEDLRRSWSRRAADTI